MIGKDTKLFALMGPNLSASRLYQAYNYLFEANGVDAAFVNISVPAAKMRFTLENLGNSEIKSVILSAEASSLDEVRLFFGTDKFVSKVDIKDGKIVPSFSPVAADEADEDALIEAARLHFFEWFGYYPKIPSDIANTLRESAPRESILTRSE